MLETCIFIGITVATVSSSKKCWIFIREDTRNSVLKFSIWHCRNPFFSASKECITAPGPLSNLRVISGEDLEWITALWSEPMKKEQIKIVTLYYNSKMSLSIICFKVTVTLNSIKAIIKILICILNLNDIYSSYVTHGFPGRWVLKIPPANAGAPGD